MDKFDEKYKDKNPFRTPTGYFDNLSSRIIDKVEEQNKPKDNKIGGIIKSFLWLAASFIIIIGLAQVIIPLVINPAQKIERGAASIVYADTAKASDTTKNLNFVDEIEITDDAIIEYLSEENIDSSMILAEL